MSKPKAETFKAVVEVAGPLSKPVSPPPPPAPPTGPIHHGVTLVREKTGWACFEVTIQDGKVLSLTRQCEAAAKPIAWERLKVVLTRNVFARNSEIK